MSLNPVKSRVSTVELSVPAQPEQKQPTERVAVWGAISKQVAEGMKTASQVLKSAGIDWTVAAKPVSVEGQVVKGYKAIVREDNGKVLSIMGSQYTPVQNADVLSFADTIVGQGQAYYESAGELKGGSKVFVNMILPGHLFVRGDKSDKIEQRVLVATSHDGSCPIVIKCVSLRVICQNTFNAALREHSDEFRVRHMPSFELKVDEAQKALKLAQAYFDDLQGVIDILAQSPFTTDQMADFATKIVPSKDDEASTRSMNMRDNLVHLFKAGTGNHGETRWHALNAVTEFVDHERATRGKDDASRAENRANAVLFGPGQKMKAQALELLMAN